MSGKCRNRINGHKVKLAHDASVQNSFENLGENGDVSQAAPFLVKERLC